MDQTEPRSQFKDYIGDGVYADIERGMLKLTTEDGILTTNTVYLEPEVYAALLRYVERIRESFAHKPDLTPEAHHER